QRGRPEGRVVARAPQHPEATAQRGEITEERAAGAHLAAVEARVADALGLDVERLLGDAGRVAQHVDEQVVAADLAKFLLVAAGLPVAADRALAEAPRGKARGRDETQVRHPGTEPAREVRGDRRAEREPGEPERAAAGEHR